MISVVCVYNDREKLRRYLEASLSSQDSTSELVFVDNTSGVFTSAASALNSGAKRCNGEFIMFAHQDVRLIGSDWLSRAEEMLRELSQVGIAGVAGVVEGSGPQKDRLRNQIIEHSDPKAVWGNPIKSPELVQTLDECLVFVPRAMFSSLEFDETTCDGWHFYVVDYCLSVMNIGFNVYAIPLMVDHESLGFSDSLSLRLSNIRHRRAFYRSLQRVLAKHRYNCKIVSTTNGDFRTDIGLLYQILQRAYSAVKRRLRTLVVSESSQH